VSKNSKKYLFLVLEVFFLVNPISPSENKAFLNDFDNIKKVTKSKDDSILGHSACEAST
jgi:hypothetical protein